MGFCAGEYVFRIIDRISVLASSFPFLNKTVSVLGSSFLFLLKGFLCWGVRFSYY